MALLSKEKATEEWEMTRTNGSVLTVEVLIDAYDLLRCYLA